MRRRLTDQIAPLARRTSRTLKHARERLLYVSGRTVRQTMINTSGTRPESLPLDEDIGQVRKKIKGTSKALGASKKKKSNEEPDPIELGCDEEDILENDDMFENDEEEFEIPEWAEKL